VGVVKTVTVNVTGLREFDRVVAELAALRAEIERIANLGAGAMAELEALLADPTTATNLAAWTATFSTHRAYVAGLRRALGGSDA
jgi:hypothetical protein